MKFYGGKISILIPTNFKCNKEPRTAAYHTDTGWQRRIRQDWKKPLA